MDKSQIIEGIHASPYRLVLAATGGGSGLISALLTVPGASNTVLEAIIPYSAESLHDWLGIIPDSHCSDDTALQMAAVAHRRAVELTHRSNDSRAIDREAVLGVGITAALSTNRDRRGDERAYLAMHSFAETRLTSFRFKKGTQSRADEEACLTNLCLILLAAAIGVKNPSNRDERAWDHVDSATSIIRPPSVVLRQVVEGTVPWAVRINDADWSTSFDSPPKGLLSGSFHPLHAAHLQLADLAAELLAGPVAFELPLMNADKPPVDYFSLLKRLKAFSGRSLIVTAAPTFVEKSHLFPGTTFIVGADTAKRICDPRFYGHSVDAMHEALSAIASRGCSFLVAARRMGGTVMTLDHLSMPEEYRTLFRAISTEQFLWDLSSTEIRRNMGP